MNKRRIFSITTNGFYFEIDSTIRVGKDTVRIGEIVDSSCEYEDHIENYYIIKGEDGIVVARIENIPCVVIFCD